MNRLFSLSLLLILLSGCASQASKEADILIHGIENQDLAVLENNKDNPYITTTKNVEPGFVECKRP
ncbi:hypothetical protein A8139_03150 [Marinomonas primoryensis]|uniref:Lipoprotein n=1 Tax=Marinomonas primoryensis TaxID=178399 RepID=A0A2Z4PPJ2_9GAMM|nr:hypothetical protein [Marinomonas primoryensis]AWX99108.1 hypothetical protein A8139_03150 [Marinomonas primoryensis]